MKHLLLALLITVYGCAGTKTKKEKPQALSLPAQPKLAFTVTEGILHPESVIYDSEDRSIIVTNLASGNPLEKKTISYLSKVGLDGKVQKSKWVTGLKAPKGMAILEDHLYVSDVDRVVKIDRKKGRILKTIPVKDAKFLNDLVADADGNLYLSDMFANVIYRIEDDKLSVWKSGPELNSPNGLYTDGKEHLICASWGSDIDSKTFIAKVPGTIVSYPFKDSKTATVENTSGHFDGIAADKRGHLWVSDWISGDIYEVTKSGKATKRFNFSQGTADLTVVKDQGLLLIPQMNQNKVIAIQLD